MFQKEQIDIWIIKILLTISFFFDNTYFHTISPLFSKGVEQKPKKKLGSSTLSLGTMADNFKETG